LTFDDEFIAESSHDTETGLFDMPEMTREKDVEFEPLVSDEPEFEPQSESQRMDIDKKELQDRKTITQIPKRKAPRKKSGASEPGSGIRERKSYHRMVHGANIKVIGVGGAGGNAINRMVEAGLEGVEFVAVNTDLQALDQSLASRKIQIGLKSTRGLGAGGDPEVGLKSAMESKAELGETLEEADMVFITAGMGGGTGTGAAPVIAELSKERGALTIGVVTKPFTFEGFKRRQVAERGIQNLRDALDALITIPNDKLLDIIKEETTLVESFRIADDVLRQGVQGISDLIIKPGLINLDFADVKAIMLDAGTALIGIGRASGENRAIEAARMAITSPLLETSIEGAKGILINITGSDIRLSEVNQAAEEIYEVSDKESNIIFGTAIDDSLKGEIRITVLATGFVGTEDEPPIPIKETFYKTTTPQQPKGLTHSLPDDNLTEDDLDIPTFLRRGNYQE
jgi:cell division protein FtsZ